MRSNENIQEKIIPMDKSAAHTFDLISMYPGAIEGGIEQIIVDIIPAIVKRDDVRAWAFERGNKPVPVVTLLLDLEQGALEDVVDTCEEMLSSSLRDEPRFALRQLVETTTRMPLGADVPWGVNHTQSNLSNQDDKVARQVTLEQAVSNLALRVLTNVRAMEWDRKTIAPTLLHSLLRLGQNQCADVTHDAYGVMQALLDGNPSGEALIRQYRIKARQLSQSEVSILLNGSAAEVFHDQLVEAFGELRAAIELHDKIGDVIFLTSIWRRLAAGLGFLDIEAAYIACLTSTAANSDSP
jgi:hypothetical protein